MADMETSFRERIHYRIDNFLDNADENYGVTLIPPKDKVIELSDGDALVVVAEDER